MRVTTHIRKRLEARTPGLTRRALIVIPTRDGGPIIQDRAGSTGGRCVHRRRETHEAVQSPSRPFRPARAFGEFQRLLVDLPDGRLNETIPDFHHTRKRFTALQQAIQKDHYNRAQDARSRRSPSRSSASRWWT